jgi:hypothetical protein
VVTRPNNGLQWDNFNNGILNGREATNSEVSEESDQNVLNNQININVDDGSEYASSTSNMPRVYENCQEFLSPDDVQRVNIANINGTLQEVLRAKLALYIMDSLINLSSEIHF